MIFEIFGFLGWIMALIALWRIRNLTLDVDDLYEIMENEK